MRTNAAADAAVAAPPGEADGWMPTASCLMLGYAADELAALSPRCFVHPEDFSALSAARESLSLDTPSATCRYRMRHKAGHWVWVEAVFQLARPGLSDRDVTVTMRDVTERRRFEAERDLRGRELETSNANLERLARHLARARDEAQRANRAKSRFLAGMSHELRTPLNGILGYAQLLRDEGGLTKAQATRVDAMLGAGTHLLQMINCVLDLSEIEAERVEIHNETVELSVLARACLDLVAPAAKAKYLALSLDMPRAAPRAVTTDPTRLRQILLNLLGNAVKFTATGAVALRVRVDGDALRFEVADTGPGIPEAARPRLFQDFGRLDTAASSAEEGAGLGLFLSAQLAALLGGRLGHAPNPGGGSVFWLELPLILAPRGELHAGGPETMRTLGAPTAEPVRRILVVDDVAMNRDIAAAFLRAAGHDVTCAPGGREAVEMAATTDFDVILMDVRMPDMDGLEATRRIRAIGGAPAAVPVVALTALAFTEQVAECRAAGMDSYLAKPFTPEALRATIAKVTTASNAGAQAPAASDSAARFGADLPVLDPAALERTVAFLDAESVQSHLRSLSMQASGLRRTLAAIDFVAGASRAMAEAAHALAGSAGMFGFERLALVARHFEHAALTGSPDVAALADDLAAALDASLGEIAGRLTPAVAA